MNRIMFVCLGNICRSPMAEIIFRDMVNKAGRSDEFVISSSATSGENV
ncbi:MAG: low molecular weight phosphotyrosine protein phosphatase, partial [Clostridia bacterium]|nr:low molecular weight phosphotyrosine protein phosphatase [Clostridia bacterium]